MPERLSPVTRSDLIRRLRRLGYDSPFSGGRHEFMVRNTRRLILPNPHRQAIGSDLLARLLKQADVTRHEWEQAE